GVSAAWAGAQRKASAAASSARKGAGASRSRAVAIRERIAAKGSSGLDKLNSAPLRIEIRGADDIVRAFAGLEAFAGRSYVPKRLAQGFVAAPGEDHADFDSFCSGRRSRRGSAK